MLLIRLNENFSEMKLRSFGQQSRVLLVLACIGLLCAIQINSQESQARKDAAGKEKLHKELTQIFDDKDLSSRIGEYLEAVPTNKKTGRSTRRFFGLLGRKNDESDKSISTLTDVLNMIFGSLTEGRKCKKKCKPCPERAPFCPYCPKCQPGCPPCKLPSACKSSELAKIMMTSPALSIQDSNRCPPKPTCPPCPGSTVAPQNVTTPASTGAPPTIAATTSTSTTTIPPPKIEAITSFGRNKKHSEPIILVKREVSDIEAGNKKKPCKKCKKKCPYTSTSMRPSTSSAPVAGGASITYSPTTTRKPSSTHGATEKTRKPPTTQRTTTTTRNPPTTQKVTTTRQPPTTQKTTITSKPLTTSVKPPTTTTTTTSSTTRGPTASTVTSTTTTPSPITTSTAPPNFNFEIRGNFSIVGNLKVLIGNRTIVESILSIFDRIPRRVDNRESSLAKEILGKFGDEEALKLMGNSTSGDQERSMTLLTAQDTARIIVGHILDAFKRKKCNCKPCVPNRPVDCPKCYYPRPACSEIVSECQPCPKWPTCRPKPTTTRKPETSNTQTTTGCPSYPTCPPCESQIDKSRPKRSKHSYKNPAFEDDPDSVDPEDPVGEDELSQQIDCDESRPTCKLWKYNQCGNYTRKPIYMMSGGMDVNEGMFPSHVRLDIDLHRVGGGAGRCSGVLISDRHILTAGHCVRVSQETGNSIILLHPKEVTAILGESDIKERDEQRVRMKISSICMSNKYKEQAGSGESQYDFAVLTLERKVDFEENINMACLPYSPVPLKEEEEDTNCYVVGAGITKYDLYGFNHVFSKKVQYMKVKRVTCKGWGIKHDDRSRHCFTKSGGPGDTCGGDSGGPILCFGHRNKWYVAGLVSYGSTYCDGTDTVGWTGVYTRIPALIKQITSNCQI